MSPEVIIAAALGFVAGVYVMRWVADREKPHPDAQRAWLMPPVTRPPFFYEEE